MNSKTSNFLKLVIPGLIAFVLSLYFLYSIHTDAPGPLESKEIVVSLVVAVVAAALYHLSKLRSVVTAYKIRKIDLNIKTTLFNLYTDEVTKEQKQYLFADDRLMDVFFELINENKELKGIKNRGAINEVIWTSLADLGILSLFCSIAFFVSTFLYPKSETELIIKGFWISLLSIIALAAHNLSFVKLINKSNRVLIYVENNLLGQLDQKIQALLK